MKIFGNVDIQTNQLLRFFDADNSNRVAVKAPATVSSNFDLTLPAAQATNDDVVTAQSSGQLSFGKIANANIASGAAIDASKIADGSVSSTEFQYLANVTSDIQSQFGGKASTALDNLASVAINTSLISDTDNTDDLGSASIGWATGYINQLRMDSNGQTTGLQGSASASASVNYTLPAAAPAADGYVLKSTMLGVMSWEPDASSASFAADWVTADGASKVVTHNLGTKDVIVQVYNEDDDSTIYMDSVVRTNTNSVTLTASEAPATSWRVVILAAA